MSADPTPPPGPATASATLAALLDEILVADREASPVAASALGCTEYDDRLDDCSADAWRARDGSAAAFVARLDAVADDGLGADERIDRDLGRSVLRGRGIVAPFEAWRRDPAAYTGPIANGCFVPLLHRLRPEAELVPALERRLAGTAAVVDAGIRNLDPALAHPLIVERGLGAARGVARYLRELAWREIADDRLALRLREAGGAAALHVDRLVAHLEAFARAAHGSWMLGEERCTAILREREMLADDARSLRERGRDELAGLEAEMRIVARDAAGSPDFAAVLRSDDERHPPTEEAMRATYEAWTERARAFLAETGLVTLPPGETCAVVPSPVFQRPVLGVASYVAPPAFSDRWRGHFFVPFAPDGADPEEVRGRLRNNAYGSIPTTAVHETYPGHHWHLVMRKLHASAARRTWSTPYFSEGWALYAERVMRERGFFTSPIEVLHHLNATLFRACRIVVDTSLHLGEMTFDAAVAFMRDRASLPEPVARAEVGRYCWWPTQASSYLTGCLEILRIRERHLAVHGYAGADPATVPVGVLRAFHDRIAASGALPLGLAARAVEAGDPSENGAIER